MGDKYSDFQHKMLIDVFKGVKVYGTLIVTIIVTKLEFGKIVITYYKKKSKRNLLEGIPT